MLLVGQGAYGVVSAAVDQVKRKSVAIKKIEKAFDQRIYTKRTLRELKLLRLLTHENVNSPHLRSNKLAYILFYSNSINFLHAFYRSLVWKASFCLSLEKNSMICKIRIIIHHFFFFFFCSISDSHSYNTFYLFPAFLSCKKYIYILVIAFQNWWKLTCSKSLNPTSNLRLITANSSCIKFSVVSSIFIRQTSFIEI